MIEIEKIKQTVENTIANSDMFVVEINLSTDNKINIVVDSDSGGVGIDDCVKISRAVEAALNRDDEDFELQVSSAGLDQPLKMLRQYKKNIGNDVDIVFTNSKKLTAKLISATESEIGVEYDERALVEGKKRKQLVHRSQTLALSDIRTVKVNVSFK